jgi:hypothetical protein
MAHIYMHFDFGADENKAQEARHKLDGWKQAFRLDKKLQYKLERPAADSDEVDDAAAADEETEKPKHKSKKPSSRAESASSDSESTDPQNVSLLVRLYFSNHEKLSEQRWLDRLPTEEPFKSASPKVIRQGDPGFDQALKQFADLD